MMAELHTNLCSSPVTAMV